MRYILTHLIINLLICTTFSEELINKFRFIKFNDTDNMNCQGELCRGVPHPDKIICVLYSPGKWWVCNGYVSDTVWNYNIISANITCADPYFYDIFDHDQNTCTITYTLVYNDYIEYIINFFCTIALLYIILGMCVCL